MAERETAEEQRERQDKEKDEARKARQVRLGHVEAPKKKAEPKTESKSKDSK